MESTGSMLESSVIPIMHPMKFSRRFLIAVSTLSVAWAWSSPAWSLGWGRPESQAVLGDTLRVVVPLRLEAGETVTQECVSAEVFFGDDRVAPGAVSVELQPSETVTAGMGARLVLRTTALINEPVVNIQVSAGCQARITRRFVALADPPGMQPPLIAQAAPLPWLSSDAEQVPAAKDKARSGVPRKAEKVASVDSAQSSRPHGGPSRKEARRAQRDKTVVASAEAPRLALDPINADSLVQPNLRSSGQLVAPVEGAQAASEVQARRDAAAALWRALNATPEDMLRQQRHVEQLEQRLHSLQRSGEQTQQSVSALQARMQALEQPARSGLSWPLVLALLAGLGVVAWLLHGWGVRRGREQAAAWWSPETGQPPLNLPESEDTHSKPHLDPLDNDDLLGPIPEPDEEDRLQPTPVAAAAATASGHRFTAPASIIGTSAPQPSLVSPEPLKAVSVEELIDLEQQAEFFIVLGQDEAAIELLEVHLGGHAQEIPWPYLKLLEIYRRLGRRADYERVQERFNAHFNGRAPTWESDLEHGRSLVDYPGVIERLQALWAEPARAMDVLEMSLVHLGTDADAFDLPAYRELLFLYAVARDLADRAERRHPASTDVAPLTATQPVRSADLNVPAVEPLSVDLDFDRLDDRA